MASTSRRSNKKSQSEVISTVLLILLVIVTFIIILGFVIPFIQNQLSKADCVNVIGELSITNGRYTCYDVASKDLYVQIHLGNSDLLEGFSIETGGAFTDSFEIREGNSNPIVGMYGEAKGGVLNLPGSNEERTYSITVNSAPDDIKVYPILPGGVICPSSSISNDIAEC